MKAKSDDFKANGELKIQIRKKNKYFRLHMLFKLGCFILIASISGATTSKLIVDKKFKNYDYKNNMDDTEINNGETLQKQCSNVVNKAAVSLVTISDDISNLKQNRNSKKNISGIVVNKEGYILTNYSKVKDYEKIYVKLPAIASEPVEGRLINGEERSDIAMIKIEAPDLSPIKIADADSFREGDFVIAIGNAIADDFVGIAFPGIITSVNDTIELKDTNQSFRVIQTSAKIDYENTGGVLCNMKGELVGLNTEKITKEFSKVGVYYAVGVRGVKEVMEQLLSTTDILGINGGRVINDEEKGIHGIYVNNMDQNGYAAKAGIKPTDIITRIDGKDINTSEDIFYEIKDKKDGDIVECDILRDGRAMKIYIKI